MSGEAKRRYSCGEHVIITDRRDLGPTWSGGFIIIEVLPQAGAALRYRLVSAGGTIDRLADQSQLSAAFSITR